jgi:hypothetical protein
MKIKKVAAIGGFFAAALVGVVFASSAAARAATPEGSLDVTKTLTVQVADRDDSGKGSPTTWARDTFKRDLTITTEGPAQDAESKTMQQTPVEQICETVKKVGLRWNYKMVGQDEGAFVTVSDSATGSPGEGKSLVKGATGSFKGGFTATFEAPAFWCSYDSETNAEQRKNTSSSEYPGLLFGDEVKGVDMPKWSWDYTRCAGKTYVKDSYEKWTNGAAGNTGDIRGAKCVDKPVPPAATTPPVTAPPVAAPEKTLPKTGPSGALFLGVGLIAVAGGSILYVVAQPKRKLR